MRACRIKQSFVVPCVTSVHKQTHVAEGGWKKMRIEIEIEMGENYKMHRGSIVAPNFAHSLCVRSAVISPDAFVIFSLHKTELSLHTSPVTTTHQPQPARRRDGVACRGCADFWGGVG